MQSLEPVQPPYVRSLEVTLALLASFAEERRWLETPGITTAHIEEYLDYLQARPRWFGERSEAASGPFSQSYVDERVTQTIAEAE